MTRQKDCCADCGYNFTEQTRKVKRNEKFRQWNKEKNDYDVSIFETEYTDFGEVDHIIPIHKGGEILGIENLQLLCRNCHLIKSANERRKS